MNYHNEEKNSNILYMTAKQRCEYLQARLDALHAQDKKWSCKYIAELSGLTESTVRHVIKDPEYETSVSSLRDLCRVMGDTSGQDVVYMDKPETLELIAAKDEEIRQLNEAVSRMTETIHRLRDNIDFYVEEAKMKTAVIKKLLETKAKV